LSDAIGGFFGGCGDKATSGMIGYAKQAFKESMDYFRRKPSNFFFLYKKKFEKM
jgi:hypothetical protein